MSASEAQSRPVVSMKIRPRDADIRRLYEELGRVIERHPNLRLAVDPDSQEIAILGTDPTQLVRAASRIRRNFSMAFEVGDPEVIYLETIRRTAESESRFILQTGGQGNYAHVKLRVEAIDPEKGIEFIDGTNFDAIIFPGTAKTIPDEYIPAVEQGIREAALRGVQGDHEIVGVKVTLYDGSYHETDSNEMAFRIAASTAFSEAVARADRILLEPIVAAEIGAPEEFTRIVKHDFENRRGRITGLERRDNLSVVHAIVPLAEMLGRPDSELKMRFLRYAEAPLPDESGDDGTGVIARTPRGPRPKHGFTRLPEPE